MKQMYGLLLFDTPEARHRGVAVLEAGGYTITFLDWVDEIAGVIVSPVCWIEVRGLYEGSDVEFLTEMGGIVNKAGGEVIEAGLEFPVSGRFRSQDDNDDDNVPANLRD